MYELTVLNANPWRGLLLVDNDGDDEDVDDEDDVALSIDVKFGLSTWTFSLAGVLVPTFEVPAICRDIGRFLDIRFVKVLMYP